MRASMIKWLDDIRFAFAELHNIQFAAPWRRRAGRC